MIFIYQFCIQLLCRECSSAIGVPCGILRGLNAHNLIICNKEPLPPSFLFVFTSSPLVAILF